MKKTGLTQLISLLIVCSAAASFNSRNGYRLPSEGVIRALVVFAEPDSGCAKCDRAAYNKKTWPRGEMPNYTDRLFDTIPSPNPQGSITKYYYIASMGKLSLLGDYYPDLITIPAEKCKRSVQANAAVCAHLDSLHKVGELLPTNAGYDMTGNSFDAYTIGNRDFGVEFLNQPDNSVDLLVIIWRCLPQQSDGSGFSMYNSSNTTPMKDKVNTFSCFTATYYTKLIMVHEISHLFLGPNSFHNGGRSAGTRQQIHFHAGYGILAADGTNIINPSAWDRYRLGWLKDDSPYDISDANGRNADIDLDTLSSDSICFLLRDFNTYNDAVRIKIPYMDSMARVSSVDNQWLWLTNFQSTIHNGFNSSCEPKGIRANIQIGNNKLQSKLSEVSYYNPLNKRGNYDFSIEKSKKIVASFNKQNPFTGISISHRPMIYNGGEKIIGDEYILPREVELDGKSLPEDSCCYSTYPGYGNSYDTFKVGDSITLSTNPAPVNQPVYRMFRKTAHPNVSKNLQTIHLSGLGIYITDSLISDSIQGAVLKVTVRKNDYRVQGTKRWCGNIELHDSVLLQNQSTIVLDRGRTPQRLKDPKPFGDTLLFTDLTELKVKSNALLSLKEQGQLILKNGSSVVVDKDGIVELGKRSEIVLMDSARLILKKGAVIRTAANGMVRIIGDEAIFTIEQGACVGNNVEYANQNGFFDKRRSIVKVSKEPFLPNKKDARLMEPSQTIELHR